MTAKAASAGGATTALVLLFLVATVNFVDRQVLVILLVPIAQDLDLTDTQLGLLTGVAFALCFAVAGLPIARWAETTSRRWIIFVSLAAWSLLTAACGFASTFLQLFAMRILVAIGESGSGPASQSMIADLYPHGRRSMALAVLSCSIPAGALIGLFGGGVLNEAVGWRQAFIIVGLPGLLLAVAFIFTIKEPQRAQPRKQAVASEHLYAAFKTLWSIRSYRLMAFAAALHLFVAAGLNQWIGIYMIRTYKIGTAEAGLALGVLIGGVGLLGTLLGGFLGDRLGRRKARWFGWLPALVVMLGVPLTIGMYFAPTFEGALWLFIGPVLAATVYTGPVFGAVQSIAPPHLRATAAALTMLLGGVIGQAGGPVVVGILSDLLQPAAGERALRWALITVAPLSLVAGALFWRAGLVLETDLAHANDPESPQSQAVSTNPAG